jgi:hypothetical protein
MKSPRNCQARGGGAPNCQEIAYSASGRREEEKKVECRLEKWSKGFIPRGPDLSGEWTGLVQWDVRLDLSGKDRTYPVR